MYLKQELEDWPARVLLLSAFASLPVESAPVHADQLSTSAPGNAWSDIQLVWANCRTFNAPASPICRLCAESEEALARKWAAAGLPGPAPASATGEPGPRAAQAKPKAKLAKHKHSALPPEGAEGAGTAVDGQPGKKARKRKAAVLEGEVSPGSDSRKSGKKGIAKQQRKAVQDVLQVSHVVLASVACLCSCLQSKSSAACPLTTTATKAHHW